MAEGNIHCQTEQTSDEVFDFECGPCKFDGNILKASGFCSDCSDYLCGDCFRTHRKPVPCRHHILLDASKMPKDKTTVKPKDVGTVRCEKHEDNLIEYYCSNHEYLGCSICMTLDHRSCEKVDHIPKIVDGLYTTQEYVDYKQSIDAVVKKTNSNAVELDRSSTEAERIYVSTKEQIRKHRKDLISCIDNLEKKLENDISNLNENNIFKLKQATDANDELENEIKLLGIEIKQQEDHSKKIDSFVTMKQIRCKIATFNDKADSVITHAEIDKYFLETKPIQVLGKIVKELKLPAKKATKPKIYTQKMPVQNCIICMDDVIDPKTLSCGHTFCKDCVEEQFEQHKKACPTCGAVCGVITAKKALEPMKLKKKRVLANENCVICMHNMIDPKTLPCGHTYCTDCIEEQFEHTKACPTCGAVCGVITGDQPTGTMDVITNRHFHLDGYKGYGTIVINYDLPSGYQQPNHPSPGKYYKGLQRTAYLLDNNDGRQICEMLKVAFERKLVFTIGNNRTTGQKGVITWNDIHHKTDIRPNTQFGYPDPTYCERVKDELAAKGVTEKDIEIK